MDYDISYVTQGLSRAGFYVEIFVYLMLVLAFLFIIYMVLSYRFKVMVFERRGNNIYKISKDRAKRVMDKGVTKYKLLRGKTTFPPPGDQQTYLAGKKDFFMLFRNENGVHFPIAFRNPFPQFNLVDNDVMTWMVHEFQRSSEIYDKPSFFARYGHILVQFAFVGIMFIIFLILLNKMDGVAEALRGVGGNIQVTLPGGGTPPPG